MRWITLNSSFVRIFKYSLLGADLDFDYILSKKQIKDT